MHVMTAGQAEMLTTLLAFRESWHISILLFHCGQYLMCVPTCSHAGKRNSRNDPPAL